MKIKWFGQPWPSEEDRAPICESDEDRVDVPVRKTCLECGKTIGEKDRGIITGCSPNIWGSWDLRLGTKVLRVASYHLACWMQVVVGGEITGEVLSRMQGATERYVPESEGVAEITDEMYQEYEDVNPGEGWGVH